MRKIMVLSLAVAMTACTSMDPYTGEQKTSNTTKGAAIGAIAGAVIGAATASKNDRKQAVLRGAAGGAAVGAGTGYYMDRQEAKLRQELAGSGVQVAREGDNIRLIMPGNITFATGKSDIKSGFHSVLTSVAKVLAEFKDNSILVAGHTDNVGGADLNQGLSEQRAWSVKAFLQNSGVPGGRVQAIGFGYRFPVASNKTAEGRQANRRVELELQPLK